MGMMTYVAQNAKNRLLANIDEAIGKIGHGVADQGNKMALNNVREGVESLNLSNAYKLEKAIMNAEYYDPTKDKWGFGPAAISPMDYLSFCKDAGVPKPTTDEVEELSRGWID